VKNPNRFYFVFKLNGVNRQFQFSASRYEQLVICIVSSSRSAASISKKWLGLKKTRHISPVSPTSP